MHRVRGVIQHYAWGDTDVIPQLLGLEPDGQPWAEYWLGTHRRGAAVLEDGRPLAEVAGELPYLLKVLAAARPLSLQTHPDADQAEAGFKAGVFSDPSPKPELLCAITPVEALCGIRPAADTADLLRELDLEDLAERVRIHGPGSLLHDMYRGRVDSRQIVEACSRSERREAHWVQVLNGMYPNDPSVAATVLLNLVHLEPGEALRLDAGNLHAYLHGAGIELMAASDNVVRGGLTDKEVDIDLLLATIDTTPLVQPVMELSDRYELPAAGVSLLRLEAGQVHESTGCELAFCEDGEAFLLESGDLYSAIATTWLVVAD